MTPNDEVKMYKLIKSRLTKRTKEKLAKLDMYEQIIKTKDKCISELNDLVYKLSKENAELKKEAFYWKIKTQMKILADISGLVAKIALLKSYHDRLELTARLSDIFKEYEFYERKEK